MHLIHRSVCERMIGDWILDTFWCNGVEKRHCSSLSHEVWTTLITRVMAITNASPLAPFWFWETNHFLSHTDFYWMDGDKQKRKYLPNTASRSEMVLCLRTISWSVMSHQLGSLWISESCNRSIPSSYECLNRLESTCIAYHLVPWLLFAW